MPDTPLIENDFLSQLTAVIEENLADEQFGVSELADRMNMSRSNLLRKVKKLTNLSVSQLIREVRLKRAMNMLKTSSSNVSEVSLQVGFSSTSYFIKCFREYYGYPPGEVGKRDAAELNAISENRPLIIAEDNGKRKRNRIMGSIAVIVALAFGFVAYYNWPSSKTPPLEKSIAVLPFKNDSNDSTNVYLINGLMESTLNNLQNIRDLKVISRTSAEKYRNTSRSIPELAKELNVNYIVEGSGQKIGNQILLNIQLIEAASDRHLWAKQYKREAKDIFELQQEVAKNIAQEIQAIITPEEEKRIEKKPTDDPVAYDLYLKGRDLFYQSTGESLNKAVPYFEKAIERDNEFALAYADAVMTYYYLDIFQTERKYTSQISSYADKALLYDSKRAESLIAKALYYIHKKEYELAVPYLEKALEYNPNSGLVINFLSDFYNTHIPNTAKYLEYALRGVRLDSTAQDSATMSYKYMHLANAFIQAGFVPEALATINKSLAYDPDNPFSKWIKTGILFVRDKDARQTRERLLDLLNEDTTRFYILHEVAKAFYAARDYKTAYVYYKKFIHIRETQQLDVFHYGDLTIAIVFGKVGQPEKAGKFVKSFKLYADGDRTIYKHLNEAVYYAYTGDQQKAIEQLTLFSKEDNIQYWVLLLENDPLVDTLRDLPAFRKVMQDIKTRFWDNHKKTKAMLEEKGLL